MAWSDITLAGLHYDYTWHLQASADLKPWEKAVSCLLFSVIILSILYFIFNIRFPTCRRPRLPTFQRPRFNYPSYSYGHGDHPPRPPTETPPPYNSTPTYKAPPNNPAPNYPVSNNPAPNYPVFNNPAPNYPAPNNPAPNLNYPIPGNSTPNTFTPGLWTGIAVGGLGAIAAHGLLHNDSHTHGHHGHHDRERHHGGGRSVMDT